MLKIKSGNIFDYLDNVEAIINSNNQYMISGSGMCGMLYKIAGKKELESYCEKHFSNQMKTNEIRVTPGFNIGKDIIHIYAPKKYEYNNYELESVEILIKAYENIFIEAYQRGYKSLLSVSIGTGVHGYKHSEIALQLVPQLKEFSKKYNINFILVLPSDEIAKIYLNILNYNRFVIDEEDFRLSYCKKGEC